MKYILGPPWLLALILGSTLLGVVGFIIGLIWECNWRRANELFPNPWREYSHDWTAMNVSPFVPDNYHKHPWIYKTYYHYLFNLS